MRSVVFAVGFDTEGVRWFFRGMARYSVVVLKSDGAWRFTIILKIQVSISRVWVCVSDKTYRMFVVTQFIAVENEKSMSPGITKAQPA